MIWLKKKERKRNILTLSVGELLSESVSSDDQHPLDPPEQHYVIALQLDKHMLANNLPFETFPLIINETKVSNTNISSSFSVSFLPQNQQSVSGSSRNLSCTGYSGKAHSARSVCDIVGATCP